MDKRQYGPFVHTLNKGGLRAITTSSKLRGTQASNHLASDSVAVRAYVGTFEHQRKNKNWNSRLTVHIEFFTDAPPRSDLPPGYAEWCDAQLVEGYLQIYISRVLNGVGETIPVG